MNCDHCFVDRVEWGRFECRVCGANLCEFHKSLHTYHDKESWFDRKKDWQVILGTAWPELEPHDDRPAVRVAHDIPRLAW